MPAARPVLNVWGVAETSVRPAALSAHTCLSRVLNE